MAHTVEVKRIAERLLVEDGRVYVSAGIWIRKAEVKIGLAKSETVYGIWTEFGLNDIAVDRFQAAERAISVSVWSE